MTESPENRSNIIQAITAPLGFFSLSLLIVEGFLAIIMISSGLDQNSKFWGMIIGTGLFLFVELGVLLLVWFKPTHLTFGEKSHLQLLEMQKLWGTSDKPNTKQKVEKEENLKQEQASGSAPAVAAQTPPQNNQN